MSSSPPQSSALLALVFDTRGPNQSAGGGQKNHSASSPQKHTAGSSNSSTHSKEQDSAGQSATATSTAANACTNTLSIHNGPGHEDDLRLVSMVKNCFVDVLKTVGCTSIAQQQQSLPAVHHPSHSSSKKHFCYSFHCLRAADILTLHGPQPLFTSAPSATMVPPPPQFPALSSVAAGGSDWHRLHSSIDKLASMEIVETQLLSAVPPPPQAAVDDAAIAKPTTTNLASKAHIAAIRTLITHAFSQSGGGKTTTTEGAGGGVHNRSSDSFKEVHILMVSCVAHSLVGLSLPASVSLDLRAKVTLIHVNPKSGGLAPIGESNPAPHLRLLRLSANRSLLRTALLSLLTEEFPLPFNTPSTVQLSLMGPSPHDDNDGVDDKKDPAAEEAAAPVANPHPSFSSPAPSFLRWECQCCARHLFMPDGLGPNSTSFPTPSPTGSLKVLCRVRCGAVEESLLAGTPFSLLPRRCGTSPAGGPPSAPITGMRKAIDERTLMNLSRASVPVVSSASSSCSSGSPSLPEIYRGLLEDLSKSSEVLLLKEEVQEENVTSASSAVRFFVALPPANTTATMDATASGSGSGEGSGGSLSPSPPPLPPLILRPLVHPSLLVALSMRELTLCLSDQCHHQDGRIENNKGNNSKSKQHSSTSSSILHNIPTVLTTTQLFALISAECPEYSPFELQRNQKNGAAGYDDPCQTPQSVVSVGRGGRGTGTGGGGRGGRGKKSVTFQQELSMIPPSHRGATTTTDTVTMTRDTNTNTNPANLGTNFNPRGGGHPRFGGAMANRGRGGVRGVGTLHF